MLNNTNKTEAVNALMHALKVMKNAYLHVSANQVGMSSGDLYAILAAEENWQSIETYHSLLGLMERSKMVKVKAHWVTALPLE
jgi:hypothetical protein